MKLYSALLEKRVLKTMCARNSASSILLGAVKEEDFVSEVAVEAYKQFRSMLTKKAVVPTWESLITDPALSDFTKNSLQAFAKKPAQDEAEANTVLGQLKKYAKARKINEIGKYLSEQLSSEQLDVDMLADSLYQRTTEIISSSGLKMVRFGKDSNIKAEVNKLLRTDPTRYIPTGFDSYDSQNRGIARGANWLIGAPTGAGKSLLTNQIALNVATRGFKVAVVTLEMSNSEEVQRTMANVGNVDMLALLDPDKRIDDDGKNDIRRKMKRFNKKIAECGGQLVFVEPEEDVDIKQILFALKPYGFDLILIDYIGLLSLDSKMDQWQGLGNASRFAKRWAGANNAVVGLAAQITLEGAVRYSQTIVEHASNAWLFLRQDETPGDSFLVEVDQPKCRNGRKFKFSLHIDQRRMTARDPTEEELGTANAQVKKTQKNTKEADKARKQYLDADD